MTRPRQTASDSLYFWARLNSYMPVYSDESGSIKYYAFEALDGYWYIMSEETAASVTTWLYAVGSSGLAAAWADKENQDYQIPSVAFK